MQGAVKSASAHNAVSLWVSPRTFDSLAILWFHFHFLLGEEKRNIVSLRQHERDPETEGPSATWGHNLELYFMFVLEIVQ